MRPKTDKVVRTWKASPEDMAVLNALKKARVEDTETALMRAGLRLLAKKRKVFVDSKKVCERNGNNNPK